MNITNFTFSIFIIRFIFRYIYKTSRYYLKFNDKFCFKDKIIVINKFFVF